MSTAQIVSLMWVLWNNEYLELNPDGQTFYAKDLHQIFAKTPKLLRQLAPATYKQQCWAAGAWEDYRELLKRKPRQQTKEYFQEKAIRTQAAEMDRLQRQIGTLTQQNRTQWIQQLGQVNSLAEPPKLGKLESIKEIIKSMGKI